VQAVARAERLFTVARGAFQPPPKVESAVIRLTPLAEPLVSDARLASFRRLVVGLFGFRRKQLLRAVRELTGWPPERVRALLESLQLDPTARPEILTPTEFAALTDSVVDAGWEMRADL
jgi:16S rRNA (adenine1518-N6/adenine1519-N6)-dimethyltransferase